MIIADPFFNSRREHLVMLAARYAVPACYAFRNHAVTGGLISYGGGAGPMSSPAGVYVGRILKGEKRPTSCHAANQIRVRHQPEDREGAGPHGAAIAAPRADEVIDEADASGGRKAAIFHDRCVRFVTPSGNPDTLCYEYA